jgi:hypothetical protein
MRYCLPIVLLALNGCCDPPCSSERREVAHDTVSDRYALTELRNCGATTGYATVVRVGRGRNLSADAEEVFVADSNHGSVIGGDGGLIWTDVGWTSSGKLKIAYASQARVFKRQPTAQGAIIVCRATDPPAELPVP